MSQTTNKPRDAARLVSALIRLERDDKGSDRATMANLRNGLRAPNGRTVEMMPFLVQYLPPDEPRNEHDWRNERDERFFQIAALFALHPENSYAQSFASAFRLLASKSDSIEKRFQMLLACEGDRLFHHLQQCVSLLKSENIPLNWRQLLEDLAFNSWDDPERKLQLRWARDFYRQNASSTSNDNATTSADLKS